MKTLTIKNQKWMKKFKQISFDIENGEIIAGIDKKGYLLTIFDFDFPYKGANKIVSTMKKIKTNYEENSIG